MDLGVYPQILDAALPKLFSLLKRRENGPGGKVHSAGKRGLSLLALHDKRNPLNSETPTQPVRPNGGFKRR